MMRGWRCCSVLSPELEEMRWGEKVALPGSALLRGVTAALGWKVTEDVQKMGDAKELAAEFKQ